MVEHGTPELLDLAKANVFENVDELVVFTAPTITVSLLVSSSSTVSPVLPKSSPVLPKPHRVYISCYVANYCCC